MSDRPPFKFVSSDETATMRFGAALAHALPVSPPNRALRLHLRGDLGAGKTTLVRGLLRELGVTGAVRSPTYALYELYAAGRWQAVHLDLYRLTDPREVANLGLADHDEPHALWLIEWPERAEGALPAADLELWLTVDGPAHRIALQARGEVGEGWLTRLSKSSQF